MSLRGDTKAPPPAGPLTATNGGGLRLQCKVVPRASRLRFGPALGDRLKVQLPAPPVDGAANDALVRALADALGLPRRSVLLVLGQSSKQKTVELAPLDEATRARIIAVVGGWCAE